MDPEPEPPVDEGDDALVRRAIGGEHDAFATLIERHARTARRLARRVLSDREEVEDVLQEAALAAYLNLRSLKAAERFAGWFCGIVLNHCRMRLRQARRSPDMRPLDTAVPAQPDGGAAVEEQLLLADVTEAARSLPEAQRDAALLVYFDGLTPAEAAVALGISSSALKVRLHRARNALRSQFGVASSQATTRKAARRRAGMIELEVFDVFLQRRTSKDGREITNAVILLQEKGEARILPIWIGEAEATALALELQGVQLPRPLTYHFTAALLEAAKDNLAR
ncbi:MAG: bifunctional nuclease domain-containing protein, partial [Dehalococcoidia bacterium]|nr:bifunctional nuclease domain-containing protein [Dehalococcoidia bacterium]